MGHVALTTGPQAQGLLRPADQGCGSRSWKHKLSYFNGSGSAKSMPLSLPHHLKKHVVNNLLDIISFNLQY